jgi:hypothetical protein
LVRLDSGSIVVRTAVADNRGNWSDRDSTIPVTADTRLYMSMGRRGHGGKGALIGLGVGAGLTLLAVVAAASEPEDSYVGVTAAGAIAGVAVGGGIGALIGFGIGSAARSEIWAEMPLSVPPVGDPYDMTEGMIRLGLRVNF